MHSIILGIIKHFKGDYYREIKNHLQEKEGLEEEEDLGTKESLIFAYLIEKFNKTDEIVVEVTNRDITFYLLDELQIQPDDSEAKKSISKSIGWALKNYGLIKRRDNIKKSARATRYIIYKSDLIDTLSRFHYKTLLENLSPQTPEIPQSPLNNGISGINGISGVNL